MTLENLCVCDVHRNVCVLRALQGLALRIIGAQLFKKRTQYKQGIKTVGQTQKNKGYLMLISMNQNLGIVESY